MKKLMILIFLLSGFLLQGENFRETKKEAWSSTSINNAMLKLYGTSKSKEDARIIVSIPKIASNGGAVPIHISTTISAKSVAIFTDTTPFSLIAVYTVYDVADYFTKIKMGASGMVVVVVEGKDGTLYSTTRRVEVALGGCEGGGGGSYYTSASKPRYNTEEYSFVNENRFKEVATSALSTFSIDVDTASYSNIRRYLLENSVQPPKGVVRVEEMINYFTYDYEEPTTKEPFAVHTKVGQSIWNKNSKLIQIGLQTKKVDISELPANNLVFLLDVSGSMYDDNKLPLLIQSLKLLTKQLREKDRVSIVVYAGNSGLILDRAKGNEQEKIVKALKSLRAGGQTAGADGIKLAYDVAKKAFIKGGNNRIILATDGDFNLGQSSESALVELIEKERKSGIYLTVLGFGMGNYKDNKMELLADKGNGNYAYIDNLLEAKKVLVTELGSTLYTVAKDVKIQVEFNPKKVHSYRLIGYENRVLNNEDFKNDKVDAGEIGMGHSVTALYEVLLQSPKNKSEVGSLKYQKATLIDSEELATVKIRYKQPDGNQSLLMSQVINEEDNDIKEDDFNFVQTIVGFAMLLQESEFKKDLSYRELIELAKNSKGKDKEGYRAEFIKMMEQSELLQQK